MLLKFKKLRLTYLNVKMPKYFLFFVVVVVKPMTKRASLVTQLVKNPPAMWETWVRSLGWEGLLEKGKATHSSILAWRIPRTV